MKQSGGPVAWNCRTQSTVALSTTEAEYMAVSAVTQEAVWWKGFRQELLGCVEPVTIYCDNRSAIYLAEKQIGYSSRSKHIDIHLFPATFESQTACFEPHATTIECVHPRLNRVPVRLNRVPLRSNHMPLRSNRVPLPLDFWKQEHSKLFVYVWKLFLSSPTAFC